MNNSCQNDTKPKTFKEWIYSSKFWKPALGVIIGGTLGFLYYHYEGCISGSCGITSNPYSSALFGSVIGLFIVNSPCKSC